MFSRSRLCGRIPGRVVTWLVRGPTVIPVSGIPRSGIEGLMRGLGCDVRKKGPFWVPLDSTANECYRGVANDGS